MSVKVTILGAKEANRFLKRKRDLTDSKKDVALKKAGFFLQGEVKSSIAGRRPEPTSVDTGRFLNSVDIAFGKYDGIVFTNIPYAKFLEFGTSRIRPRRHFGNSKARNQNQIISIFKSELV